MLLLSEAKQQKAIYSEDLDSCYVTKKLLYTGHINSSMKQYLLIMILIILVTACAPKVEIEEAYPVGETETGKESKTNIEEPVIQEPAELPAEVLKTEEITSIENLIEIEEDSFYPKEKIIRKDTKVEWIKKDARSYKLACYLEGTRVIQSPDLKQGDTFTYKFLKDGEYTCITYPYGLRSTITVRTTAPLLSPTGNVVLNGDKGINGASLAVMAIIAITLLLFFNHGRKKHS